MRPFIIFLLFLSARSYSQSSIWGTVKNGGQYDYGYLYKTNATGDNRVVIHHFDSINGKSPGPVIQASNGKLYGMTAQGGSGVVMIGLNRTQGGTLFEYDPVIDSFRTLIHFNATNPLFPQLPTRIHGPSDLKLLEVSPGVLWAVLTMKQNNNSIIEVLNEHVISYSIATGAIANIVTVPSWTTPLMALPRHTSLSTELYKAADGYVYSTTSGYSSCATTTDASNGSIVRIDPATNAFSYIRPFPCSYNDGLWPQGNFTEVNGKLYATSPYGGPNVVIPTFPGYGLIYEYDPAATTYTRKYDFTGGVNGGNPIGYQLKAANGKVYGATARGIVNTNFPYGAGTIYEYDAATNSHTKKADFSSFNLNTSLGSLWLCSSNGNLYGTSRYGIFEYTIATNQIRTAASLITYYDNAQPTPLIEVCQKPAYRYQSVTAYTICAGSFFSSDLQSPNAQTYTWKQNGLASATQTTGVLGFSQISLSNAGTWICEMTNACGTTTAQAISITVNPSGTGLLTSTISAAGSTSICPGSTITLSGNTNGVWSTGATAPFIQVSSPGAYQVINTNACGNTFSNIIRIDTIATPAVPAISFTTTGTLPVLTKFICQGDSALASGNITGTWNTGETTSSIYIKDNLPHYITTATACKTVTSATIQATYITPPALPTITAAGSLTICVGDSVLLDASGTSAYNWYVYNGTSYSYLSYGNQVYAKQTGSYFIRTPYSCGSVSSYSISVQANGTALTSAIITPLSSTVICQGDGVVLQSNYASCTWNTGATTQTILATGAGPYTVTNYNSCSSVTSAPMSISVTPAPAVNYTEANNAVCVTTGIFTLTPANPAGGYYTGSGVSASTFDPVLAGSGTHTVTYNYPDPGTGCTGRSMQQIAVEGNPVLTAAPSTVFCQGSSTVLFQDSPNGIWNSTGQPGLFLVVSQAGNYYVSKTNGCGVPVSSNTLQIITKPSPAISITGNTTICAGQSATLIGNGGISYTWTPGGTSTQITVNPISSTGYTLTGAGSNGCFGYAVETLTVHALPSIVVSNTSVCQGSPVVLSASGATTYTWSGSQMGASITVTPAVSGIYQVTGTDTHSCVNNATLAVTVHPLPAAPVITLTGNILSCSPAAAYQWYLNGSPLAGATSQTCSLTQNGNYTVEIQDANTCTALSAGFPVTDTGLDNTAMDAGISIFPNPNSGHFSLRLPPHKTIQIRLCNLLGQTVLTSSSLGNTEHVMQVQESGVYLVEITWNGRSYIQKLVVQKD